MRPNRASWISTPRAATLGPRELALARLEGGLRAPIEEGGVSVPDRASSSPYYRSHRRGRGSYVSSLTVPRELLLLRSESPISPKLAEKTEEEEQGESRSNDKEGDKKKPDNDKTNTNKIQDETTMDSAAEGNNKEDEEKQEEEESEVEMF